MLTGTEHRRASVLSSPVCASLLPAKATAPLFAGANWKRVAGEAFAGERSLNRILIFI